MRDHKTGLSGPTEDDRPPVSLTANLGPVSRALHVVGTFSARASVAATIAGATTVFLALLWSRAIGGELETMFVTVSAAVTLVMVFVIQHTQSRQQLVTQLKLDELLHSTPGADNRVVHLEVAADEELAEVEDRHVRRHSEAHQ